MADGLRSLRWRVAISILTVGFVWAWVSLSGAADHTIQIDYSWVRQVLDSAEVEIDGEVVGILQRYGRSQFQTGFRVGPGTHVVRILVEGCASKPDTVELGGSNGRFASRVADVDDGYTCRVLLR